MFIFETCAALLSSSTMFVTPVWVLLLVRLSLGFGLLVLIRVTTPRMKFESISKLGWVEALALV